MKKLLAVLLSAAMIFAITGCSKAPVDEENSQSETSSETIITSSKPLPLYTWDELTKKVEPSLEAVRNSVYSEKITGYINEYEQESDDFYNKISGDADYIYTYIEKIAQGKSEYVQIYNNFVGTAFTDEDFIERICDFLSSLKLQAITSEQAHSSNPKNYMMSPEIYSSLEFTFYYDETISRKIKIMQYEHYNEDIDDELALTFKTLLIDGNYYNITNYDQIKEEFFELFAITRIIIEEERDAGRADVILLM